MDGANLYLSNSREEMTVIAVIFPMTSLSVLGAQAAHQEQWDALDIRPC
jgi:hypothetical protein